MRDPARLSPHRRGVVLLEDRVEFDVEPPAIPPALPASGPLVAVAALLVDAAHRGVESVPFDPVQVQLLEGEAGPGEHRVAGVAVSPGTPLADHESPRGAPRAPVNLVERD